MKTVKIYDDEYDMEYIIAAYSCQTDVRSVKRLLARTFPDMYCSENKKELSSFHGVTYYHPVINKVIILFNKDKFSEGMVEIISTVAHECFHASTRVLCNAGITLQSDTQELYAVYYEWLFKLTLKVIVS